ncbi:MAG: phage tail sheath family protein [bacterium]|nr:phage tail sheath family protein [bacterium]
MTTPLTPGVYVREAPGGARAIESAPTAVTIFVGETERGPVGPTRINSATQFQRLFGGYHRVDATATSGRARLYMPFAVQGFFDNGGPSAYILRLVNGVPAAASLDVTDGTDTSRIDAVAPGVWANDIRIIITDAADGDAARFNLIVHYQAPGETAASEVERFEGLSDDPADEKYLVDQIRRSAYIRWRAGDPDIRPNNIAAPGVAMDDTVGVGGDGALDDANYANALAALDVVDDAALIVCASDLMLNATAATDHNDVINAVLSYAVNRPQSDLFLVADPPRSTPATDSVGDAVNEARNNITASDFIALYWPNIVVSDPVGLGRNPTLTIPAAGHIAGLYGRIDSRRGVWKAAAGVTATLSGVVGLDFHIIDQDQDRMNPHGLNALRPVPGAGRVVWGARTLRPTTEWRYINVRRTAMFLRKSIYNSIQWAVFEANDEPLWAALRETIGSFMETQFRNGAFAGETSRDAYFVKCDSDTTTEDDQIAGVVNVLVGFAPLRPAEFVLVSLSQKTVS